MLKLMQRDNLTTESLRKLFRNNFQMTNQAINLCRYYIRSGHEVDLIKILEEIQRNPHEGYLEDLMALEHEDDDVKS